MPTGVPVRKRSRRALFGIIFGLAAFAAMLVFPPPEGLNLAAWRVAAVAVLMAIWWLTEAAPVAVTALLPIGLLPLLGVTPIADATRPYASSLVFLFLGGFVIALSMERWDLHRRIALRILVVVGSKRDRIIGGFMAATALLSMWVSNTATALIMLPIALSVIGLLHEDEQAPERPGFAVALLLSIAYSASIGGLATLIGSPPNALMAGFVLETYGLTVGFVEWMAVGLPLSLVMLAVAWIFLTRLLFHFERRPISGLRKILHRELASLGPLSQGEKATAVVFVGAALSWIFRPALEDLFPTIIIGDASIAVVAAIALFIIPVREGDDWTFAMTWDWALRLPWGVLILFGGGLSLAGAISATGLADYIGSQLTALGSLPPIVVVLVVTAVIILLTELTSNTATTAAFLPVVAALAVAVGGDPLSLVVPAALAASCAFMMPVATPPNAIVFAKGLVTIPTMARAGIWLNLVAILLIAAVARFIVPTIFPVPG
ncbi:MAG: DASS family sodium-coupled anion symporter [Alphaproteobacteria bacterium]|nr:DASS family sodium-coupled anion symporter [Alphaproteobacteria bacterium]